MPENETPDVWPAWANQILILLWLLLFGGRWLFAPVLQLSGTLDAAQLAALDEGVLLKLYLILLAITFVVIALRAVRVSQSDAKTMQAASVGPPRVVGTMSMEPASEVEPDTKSGVARIDGAGEMPTKDGQIDPVSAGGDENP
jgi:hypothetical protein